MGFDGYLSFGGIEIINAARTAAYVRNLMPAFGLVRRTDIYDTLPTALEHAAYRTPLYDEADWVEISPSQQELGSYTNQFYNPTYGFYGLYPLSIQGIGDSTMRATVTQSILDGGFVGQERDTTRSIRVRGLLIGDRESAVEAGLAWLRNALRRNSCATHADQCGYTDLNYFTAPPDVCVPKWSNQYSQGSEPSIIGPLDPETSPLTTWDGSFYEEGRKISWGWELPFLDGVVVRWGMETIDGTITEYGPVYLRRSNFVVNPDFAVDTASWTATGGTINRFETDDGTYGLVDQSSPVLVRQNYLPDPSFENGDPETFGWRGSGDVTAVVDGTAPQGGKVAVVPVNVGGTWLEATALGPADAGPANLSFWKRNNADLTITVTDTLGAIVETINLTGLTGSWQRVDTNITLLERGWTVRVTNSGAQELRLDGFLLEGGGGPPSTYFDGDTATGGGYAYDFVGGPSGISRGLNGSYTTVSVETPQTQSPFGETRLSFDMRAPFSAPNVTVSLIDVDDVVIATTTINPTGDWARFALGATSAAQLRVVFSSDSGPFHVRKVLFEGGPTINDYFDGSSVEPSADYTIYWEGTANNSISRFDYVTENVPVGFDVNLNIESDVGWRPFLYVDQGYIPAVYAMNASTTQVTLEFQLQPFARTYHKVACTVGVSVIKQYNLQVGAATEVDFVITAANPHAFTRDAEFVFDNWATPEETVYSDYIQNLAINPSPQEDGAGYGQTSSGSIGGVRTAAAGKDGDFGYRVTLGASAVAGAVYGYFGRTTSPDIPVVEGQRVWPSMEVRSSVTRTMALEVDFYNSSNVAIGTATVGPTISTPSGTWTTLTIPNLVAPANATHAQLRARGVATGWLNTQTLDIDHVGIMTANHTYFDGGMADTSTEGYQWLNGDAWDSISIMVPIEQDYSALVVDPDLPVIPAAPVPPSIPDLAIDEEEITYRRYLFDIDAASVPLWANTIPTITFYTMSEDVRQLRVRFHPNPFGWDAEDVDPANYCGEFILSYLPANATLTVSGVGEQAWVSVAGSPPIPANHLLYGTGGSPMEWPQLSCHIPYVMTIDVPTDLDESDIDFALSINRRE